MRRSAIVMFLLALATLPTRASVCTTATHTTTPRWIIDHYLYDAPLKMDWEVLIDCNHPAAPAQIKLVAHRAKSSSSGKTSPLAVHAGSSVEVSAPAGAPASIHLSGTAMQTGFPDQAIRVRLKSSGRFVIALVRGPHSVELVPAAKPHWGPQ